MRAVCMLMMLGLALLAAPALAQTYPDRVIKLIAPNPAGGLGDLLIRIRERADRARLSPRISSSRNGPSLAGVSLLDDHNLYSP